LIFNVEKQDKQRNQCEAVGKQSQSLNVCFLLGLFLYPEDGGDMFLKNAG
jgi:hypothetical protein